MQRGLAAIVADAALATGVSSAPPAASQAKAAANRAAVTLPAHERDT